MPGVDVETLSAALERARVARLHLLDVMEAALPSERGDQV
jgi:polyribonucleotide nucleotidyltransferase